VQDAVAYLLGSASFVPHGYCLLWRPDLVWIHAVSDLLIALAYFSIPLALIDFVRRRRDLRFKWIFWMFAAFITACGLTHVAGLVTLWQPYYGAQGLIKAWTALVSVGTAVAIWPLIPRAVALPSPLQLQAANNRLQGEIAQRVSAEEALRRANDELELRIHELAATNQRLLREIAERQHAEEELRRAFAMLDHHVNNTPLGVIEWQQDHAGGEPARVRRWSGRAQAIFGWEGSEVLGRSAKEFGLVYEGDAVRAADAASELTENQRPFNSISLRCYTKDGKVRHCQWYNSALHDIDGNIVILSLVEDITERILALKDVYRLAHYDTLTGLPNRLMLYSRLDKVLASARRHGRGVALMTIDLDHFKNVNDSLGHVAGDELLRQVADRFRNSLRESDTLARVGGDEFVLLGEDVAGPHGVSVIARKIVDAMAEPFDIRGSQLYMSTSVGVLYDGRIQGVEALLRWPHAGGGHVMPTSFIPIAETSGLIVPLGEWVLREACRQAQIWWKTGHHLRMAVNLSAIQLREPGFALLVERVLAETNCWAMLSSSRSPRECFSIRRRRRSRRRCARSRRWACSSPSTTSERAIPALVTSRTSPSTESRSTPRSCGTSASSRGPRRS
jgi:diguanylate cyclase (GGDEF)-like protein/PAS domain S-box-containing protein